MYIGTTTEDLSKMEGNTKIDLSPAKMRCSRCPRFVTNAKLAQSTSLYKRPLCRFCLSVEYYRRQYEEKHTQEVGGETRPRECKPMPPIVECQLSTFLSELWFQLYEAVVEGDWKTYEKVTEAMDTVLNGRG